MESLAQMFAPGITLSIAGRQLRISPLRLRDHAEAAAQMRASTPSLAESVGPMLVGLDKAMQLALLERAFDEIVASERYELSRVLDWYRTPEGALTRLWLILRREQPTLSMDDVDELYASMSDEERAAFQRATQAVDHGAAPFSAVSALPEEGEPVGNDESPARKVACRGKCSGPNSESIGLKSLQISPNGADGIGMNWPT